MSGGAYSALSGMRTRLEELAESFDPTNPDELRAKLRQRVARLICRDLRVGKRPKVSLRANAGS